MLAQSLTQFQLQSLTRSTKQNNCKKGPTRQCSSQGYSVLGLHVFEHLNMLAKATLYDGYINIHSSKKKCLGVLRIPIRLPFPSNRNKDNSYV